MKKIFWKHFAAAIAALSAAATLVTVLFDLTIIQECWLYGAIGGFFVLAGSLVYAIWQVRSAKNISLSLSSEQKVKISEGDIFQKKGIICIPVNEFFDTHVGDGVVDKDTLHGMFINKYFSDRITELESKIEDKLAGLEAKECKRRLEFCPNKLYPLGTCIDIREGENLYVLFALSHFNEKDTAFLSRSEYTEVIQSLMDHLSAIVENRAVFMPLFGTGLSRLHRTPQRVLLHLIDSLDFYEKWSVPGGVNIVIKSLDSNSINLNTINHLVQEGITK